jgi:DNA-binding winged helix-turn-helix (wHTH) protein/TolB-like protein/tetratricopeptide (TPR) repeat protein
MRASRGAYIFGRFTLEPRRQLLDSGRPVQIGGKALDILSVLAEAKGDLVTKDELMAAVWPGIVVEENAIQVHISAARKALAEHADRLVTVRGKGYRFEARAAATAAAGHSGQAIARERGPMLAVFLLLLAIVGLGLLAGTSGRDRKAIAVLPFGEAGNEAKGLGAGLSDALATRLAADSRLRISGRAATSSVQARMHDPQAIGRTLGVAQLVLGNVAASGEHTRIDVQLVDARTGLTVWSQRFDAARQNIPAVQQDIATSVESALGLILGSASAKPRHAPWNNGIAYTLYLQAKGLNHRRTASDYFAAEMLLRQALRVDPDFAPAWAELAITRRAIGFRDGSESRVREEAEQDARRALLIAPDLAEAHAALVFATDSSLPDAAAHLRTAIRLDPHNAETWLWLGNVALNREGRFADALTAWRHAAALDPFWSPAVSNATDLAASLGRWSEAESYVARVRRSGIDPVLQARAEGRILMQRGAFAAAARLALSVRAVAPARQTERINWMLAQALYALGYREQAARLWSPAYPPLLLGVGAIDLPAELIGARADPHAFWVDSGKAPALLRLALRHNRCDEVAGLYEAAFPNADMFWRAAQGWSQRINLGTLVMMCLDRAGRPREAAAMRAFIEAAVERTFSQAPAPTHALVRSAFFFAADGDTRRALALLKQGVDRGWAPQEPGDAADLADEPALATLHGQPSFDALRARVRSHVAAERARLGRLPTI